MATTATTPESMNLVTTPCNEFKAQREALRCELEALLADAKERVEKFVASTFAGYGDFRLRSYTPRHFEIALHKDDKPVFGCYWDVYVDSNWEQKKSEVRCNIGTGGSFPVGKGDVQELLYVAFGRFLNQLRHTHLDERLTEAYDKAQDIWHCYYKLCKRYGREDMEMNLLYD